MHGNEIRIVFGKISVDFHFENRKHFNNKIVAGF